MRRCAVKPLAEQAWKILDSALEKGIACVVRPSMPILYFGDLPGYLDSAIRIITVGLNPSSAEFPIAQPFMRFPAVVDLDAKAMHEPSNVPRYLESLNAYFRTKPYTRWFNSSFEPLLNGMNASFYEGRDHIALHTDLCSPLATRPTWSRLGDGQILLAADGIPLWHHLVSLLEPDIILVSVARHHLDSIRFRTQAPWGVAYTVQRTNPYQVEYSRITLPVGKQSFLIFGKAANTPFGTVSTRDKLAIGSTIMELIHE